MKAGIHPEYVETTITCACGEVVHTRSTKQNIRVEICSKCHPFFSGKQKFIDTAGRIEKFDRKFKDRPVVKREPKRVAAHAPKIKMPKSQPIPPPPDRKSGPGRGQGGRGPMGRSAAPAPAKAAEKPAEKKAEQTPASA